MAPIDTFTKKLQAGEPYEAHQFLRTVVNRLVKGKKYDEGLALLYRGSLALSAYARHRQAGDEKGGGGGGAGAGGSGTDLAIC